MVEKEIKLIPEYDDYCISNKGEIFRIISNKDSKCLKELKTFSCNGHNCIKIRGQKFYIDNLVAELFLGQRPNGLLVFHKNKKKSDDRVENLIYLTPKDVQLYSTYTEEYLRDNIFRGKFMLYNEGNGISIKGGNNEVVSGLYSTRIIS